jgi:hypothetical protein
MFHVSTLLPHSTKDQQSLEKKRHIGNDRVAIVFQDEDTPFSPKMIKSKLLHVFLVVQPIKVNDETKRYKLSIVYRKDVQYFGPFLRKPFVYTKNSNLKKFILSKLINGEYATLKAPAFSVYSEKTIEDSLVKLTDNLDMLTTAFTGFEFERPRNKSIHSESIRSNSLTERNESISSPFSSNSTLFTNNNNEKNYDKSNNSSAIKGVFRKLSTSFLNNMNKLNEEIKDDKKHNSSHDLRHDEYNAFDDVN